MHNGAYFVTIVTQNRVHFFGDVKTTKMGVSTMQLSKIGKIAQKYWNEIPQHFPFIKLDKMVIMPNHIHGILWIDKGCVVGGGAVARRDAINRVSTEKTENIFAWQPRFHDRIIRNENELNRIREYIIKNPEMWYRDRNNGDL